MTQLLTSSVFFGFTITLASYMLGLWVKKKLKKEIFNPLLISIIIVVIILVIFDIDYEHYNSSAKYISYFLTPTTICLAVPLYRQLTLLKDNLLAVIIGISSSVVTSCVSIFLLAKLYALTPIQYYTLLPKSITTAIGLPLSEELGGVADITVAVIILTGIFGNLSANIVLKLFSINHPISKGVAIGSSSHAIGTVKAMELGEVTGAMSSLSIVVSGIITVVAIQFFSNIY